MICVWNNKGAWLTTTRIDYVEVFYWAHILVNSLLPGRCNLSVEELVQVLGVCVSIVNVLEIKVLHYAMFSSFCSRMVSSGICTDDNISFKFPNLMKTAVAVVWRRLIWSPWNFAHTKTAVLSWYVQNFTVIISMSWKIWTNIFLIKFEYPNEGTESSRDWIGNEVVFKLFSLPLSVGGRATLVLFQTKMLIMRAEGPLL